MASFISSFSNLDNGETKEINFNFFECWCKRETAKLSGTRRPQRCTGMEGHNFSRGHPSFLKVFENFSTWPLHPAQSALGGREDALFPLIRVLIATDRSQHGNFGKHKHSVCSTFPSLYHLTFCSTCLSCAHYTPIRLDFPLFFSFVPLHRLSLYLQHLSLTHNRFLLKVQVAAQVLKTFPDPLARSKQAPTLFTPGRFCFCIHHHLNSSSSFAYLLAHWPSPSTVSASSRSAGPFLSCSLLHLRCSGQSWNNEVSQ